eukprot:5503510-Prymnesium_polylepis.1
MASEGLTLRGAVEGRSCEGCSVRAARGRAAKRPSPCASQVTGLRGRLGCSTSAPFADGAAEPVAGGKPVSIVQNISGDLLDGGAEPHHVADAAGDRPGSLDDDEQRAGEAARSALALLATSHRRVG